MNMNQKIIQIYKILKYEQNELHNQITQIQTLIKTQFNHITINHPKKNKKY